MDPQVRYFTTSDGLSIGYWSIGGGETVIDVGRLAPMRRWYERFAVHHRFVRFGVVGHRWVPWSRAIHEATAGLAGGAKRNVRHPLHGHRGIHRLDGATRRRRLS